MNDWNPLEWAGAMAGEAGEAANAAKKLKRMETGLSNIGERLTDIEITRQHVAKECADTIFYAIFLIQRVGYDAEETIRSVFNSKSEEYGFPERL